MGLEVLHKKALENETELSEMRSFSQKSELIFFHFFGKIKVV